MTAGTCDVLAAIDGALRDYETSSDAMRWIPEPAYPPLNPQQQATARRLCAMTGVDGFAAAYMVAEAAGRYRDSPYWGDVSAAGHDVLSDVTAAFGAAARDAGRAISAMARSMGPVFASIGAAFMSVITTASTDSAGMHAFSAHLDPRTHVRCATCNPCANPGPLLYVKPSLPAGRRHARKRKWR